ncbi:MAG: hypothetical protein V5A62_14355 [Haloarculaceae archaeon]
MNDRLPTGRLLRSRVVDDPGTVLANALDRELTGYATLEPQGTLLADEGGRGVLVFEVGVPRLAYHPRTGGGEVALSAMVGPGPCRVEMCEAPAAALPAFDAPGPAVDPGRPAERLAADPDLAARTRRRAPDCEVGSAVEAFLEDEAAVDAVREEARAEAERRAEEWGLEDVLRDEVPPNSLEESPRGIHE